MRCPSCGHPESKVVDSRSADDGYSIRRRRECLSCESRFTTYERTSENPLVIIKSDGSSEAYDREKLFRGLLIACAKRPVSQKKSHSLLIALKSNYVIPLNKKLVQRVLVIWLLSV